MRKYIVDCPKMVTNNEIKQVRQLQQKKYRLEQRQFVVEGEKLVGELLAAEVQPEVLYATAEYLSRNSIDLAQQVSAEQMRRMSGLKSPPGILAVVEYPEMAVEVKLEGWILALDAVSDPGNLGTLLRIADWFGIGQVVVSDDTVEAFNPKCVQASMGAIFRVSVKVVDISNWLSECALAEFPVFGADMQGEPLNETNFPDHGVIVMGSESHGFSESVKQKVDKFISIPGGGGAESLNVAVAAGIICSRLPLQNA